MAKGTLTRIATKDATLSRTQDATGDAVRRVATDALGAGRVVSFGRETYTSVLTSTVLIPSDDTVPQNTEGVFVLGLTFKPKAAGNRIYITTRSLVSHSVTSQVIGALFLDDLVNAVAMGNTQIPANNNMNSLVVDWDWTAKDTNPHTVKLRIGGVQAGTLTINGTGGSRRFGGRAVTAITMWEVAG